MDQKINVKQLIITLGCCMLMCIAVCGGFYLATTNKSETAEAVEYEDGEQLPSGALAASEKGGTTSLTLEDGTVVTYQIPGNMYNVRDDYLALVTSAYGMNTAATSENLIVLGSDNSVYTSKDAITATTFSDLYNMFGQIYGEAWNDIDPDSIWPPVYQFMNTGELPETPYTNYSVEELESVSGGDIRYRVFKQEYDAASEDAEGNEITEHVVQLAAYSETDDVIEIIVDEENKDVDKMVKILKDFIG